MARNKVYQEGDQTYLPVAVGTVSGAPVAVGQIPGVAVTDRDSAGNATVDTEGVYNLSVKAIDGGGNSAVAVGDILYFVSADTPPISKKNTGVRFGYALDAIVAGSTATIRVQLGY